MKHINVLYIALFAVFFAGCIAPSVDRTFEYRDAEVGLNIDGVYEEHSFKTSNPEIKSIRLSRILFGGGVYRNGSLGFTPTHVSVARSDSGFCVEVSDSPGQRRFHAIVPFERLKAGASRLLIEEQWDGSDEWGTSRGITVYEIGKLKSGDLLVLARMQIKRSGLGGGKRTVADYYLFRSIK